MNNNGDGQTSKQMQPSDFNNQSPRQSPDQVKGGNLLGKSQLGNHGQNIKVITAKKRLIAKELGSIYGKKPGNGS